MGRLKEILEIQLFTKCNLKCEYCYNYFKEDIKSIDFYRKIIKIILFHEKINEKTLFVLNGGELFLWKDLYLLIQDLKKYKITLYSNGLGDYSNIENIKNNINLTFTYHINELLHVKKIDKFIKNSIIINQIVPNFKIAVVLTRDLIENKKEFMEFFTKIPSNIFIDLNIEDSFLKTMNDNEYIEIKNIYNYIFENLNYKYLTCTWEKDFTFYDYLQRLNLARTKNLPIRNIMQKQYLIYNDKIIFVKNKKIYEFKINEINKFLLSMKRKINEKS